MTRWIVAAALSCASCGGGGGVPAAPDAGPDAGPAPLAFHVDLTHLDDALLAVWAAPDQVIVVGGDSTTGLLLEWDGGATWRAPVLPDDTGVLWWAWAEPGGDAVAVGDRATVVARRGGLWRAEPVADLADPRLSLYGVWGARPDDVWAVGGSLNPGIQPAAILHYDGLGWSAADMSGLPAEALFKVWGSADNDVWAVGAAGTILHFDGESWSQAESPTAARLVAVSGRARGDVYAVGGDELGEVLRWDGQGWSAFANLGDPLSGVWTAPGRALYVGGNNGLLARFGADDRSTPDPARVATVRPLSGVDFHSLAGDDTRVLAVGADLLGDHANGWQGTLVSLGAATPGDIVVDEKPDAGPPDAAVPDAAIPDAVAVVPDAAPPLDSGVDARPATEGETCGATVPCATGLDCWYLLDSGSFICTAPCTTPDECTAYGPSACCVLPGMQVTQTVCVPASFAECVPQ